MLAPITAAEASDWRQIETIEKTRLPQPAASKSAESNSRRAALKNHARVGLEA